MGQERAAAARRARPPLDPGGAWRKALAELPGGARDALFDEWAARAWARECADQPRDVAEWRAYEDIAERQRPLEEAA
jgi:hypothetical protein